jgi:membrane protein
MRRAETRRKSFLRRILPESAERHLDWLVRLLEHDPVTEMTRAQRMLVRNVRVLFLVARWSVLKNLQLHAQALTYVTLLSLVPGMLIAFVMFKAFGSTGGVETHIQSFIIDLLSPGPDQKGQVADLVTGLSNKLDTGQVGVVAILILIWSVTSLLGQIEASFNAIFGVRTQRALATRLLTYWAVLTFGPLLLVASFALSAWFQTSRVAEFAAGLGGVSGFFFLALPLFVTWVGFLAMYLFVPNTRVRLGPALYAAIIAGSLFNITRYGYAFYAKKAVTLQNIYGSLAVIPLFILMLFVTWLLVLFGAQLAYAFQNAKTYRREDERTDASQTYLERAACRLLLEVARDFHAHRPPATLEEMTARVRVPRRLLETLVARLKDGGYLTEALPDGGLLPGMSLEMITVAEVIEYLRAGMEAAPSLVADEARSFIDELFGKLDTARDEIAGDINFRDLAIRFAPQPRNHDDALRTGVH